MTTLNAGAVVGGKFELLEPIGKGGFGTVWRARHRELDREVALKVLNPQIAESDEAQQRFLREVKASTSFVHKYAVQLREFGRDAEHGCLYFTMDLVAGKTLADVLKEEGPLPPARAVRLAGQILEALQEAHRAGFVHRDLKPANLILTQGATGEEEVRVLDFGIAKAVDGSQGSTSALTLTGTTIGTLFYMSPEQAEGLTLDGRADLYSLGVVLFECLSGKKPIEPTPGAESSQRSFLTNLMVRPPLELSSLAPHVPPPLAAVVMKALAKSPGERHASADAFRQALLAANVQVSPHTSSFAPTGPIATPPATAPPRPASAPGPQAVAAPPPGGGQGKLLLLGIVGGGAALFLCLLLGLGVAVLGFDVAGMRSQLLGVKPAQPKVVINKHVDTSAGKAPDRPGKTRARPTPNKTSTEPDDNPQPDVTLPTLTLQSLPQTTSASEVVVRGAARDANLKSVTVNGAPTKVPSSFAVTRTLRWGANEITVVARDEEGNTTTRRHTIHRRDRLQLTVEMPQPGDTVQAGTAVRIAGRISCLAPDDLRLELDGTALGMASEGRFATTRTLSAGRRTLTVVATGAGGARVERRITLTVVKPADTIASKVLANFGKQGAARGVWGSRFGKGSLAREGGSPGTEAAVKAALGWLARHQSPDGRWDSDGWERSCRKGRCRGPGHAKGDTRYDVGLTGLALLAFFGQGTLGSFKSAAVKGLDWLLKQQKSNGSIGYTHGETIYNHAIATMALCEAYAVTRHPSLRQATEQAVRFVVKAQNPMLGWKYGVRTGKNDTSVTGWMVLALKAAKLAGMPVPSSAFTGARHWFERATSSRNGSVGYESPGGGSAFLRQNDGKFDQVPCMTAVSVLCRIFTGERRSEHALRKGAYLLAASPPKWPKGGSTRKVSFYYWYYGTYAMFQVGGVKWKRWNKSLQLALLPNQRVKGCEDGSWDPVAEWCLAGGRVYGTALNALTLQIYYRYERARGR